MKRSEDDVEWYRLYFEHLGIIGMPVTAYFVWKELTKD
tara:strand:- start:292 stop:405 length:114 start_codon:yes stop_codon:yes gene_type:complete